MYSFLNKEKKVYVFRFLFKKFTDLYILTISQNDRLFELTGMWHEWRDKFSDGTPEIVF